MIVTLDNFESVLQGLQKQTYLAVDTETSGLKPYHGDRLFSVIIAKDDKEAFYFNFNEEGDGPKETKLNDIHMACLGQFLGKSRLYFLHNAKFDLAMLAKEAVNLGGSIHCTMTIERLLHNDLWEKGSFSLDGCAKRIGLAKDDTVAKYIKEHKLESYKDVPFDLMSKYALQDAKITYALGNHQIAKLLELNKDHKNSILNVYKNECRLLRTVFEMEERGVKIGRSYCEKALAYEKANLEAAQASFKRETGEDFLDSSDLFTEVFKAEKIEMGRPTATGQVNPVFDNEALANFKHPAAKAVLTYRERKKNHDFYVGFLEHADEEDILHASFNQSGTATGRFCLAKGTLIDVVRDVSKHPKGIPIEDIKRGDLVYCYDDELNLRVKKVLWQGKTGRKKIIRVHWLGQGRKHRGYLDLTPEHKVRLIDGSYVEARLLKFNQSVLSLGRSRVLNYSRLHSRDTEIREHRLIFKEVHGYLPEHVHHKDHNKLNNLVSNLDGLSGSEHTSYHSKLSAPIYREKRSALVKQYWKDGKWRRRTGSECANYIFPNKFKILKELASQAGRPTRCKGTAKDFATFKQKCQDVGVSISDVSKRYGADGKYISRGRLKKTFSLVGDKKWESLRIGYYKYRDLMRIYGLPYKPRNHVVKEIEYLGLPVDVYDLEVEDCHNFIANEICVHNSSYQPNMQQLKKDEGDDLKEEFVVRRAIVPRENYIFAMLDFNQMEYRLMLDMAEANTLIDQILGGLDVHQATANLANITRSQAKTVNFGVLYGLGQAGLAKKLNLNIAQAKEIKNAIFKASPEIKDFIYLVMDVAKQRKYLVNWFGRRYNFPDPNFAYRGPNYLVQGGCADVMKIAMNKIDAKLEDKRSKLVMQIHDEVVIELHKDELELVNDIKKIMETIYPHKRLPLTCSVEFSDKNLADRFDKINLH